MAPTPALQFAVKNHRMDGGVILPLRTTRLSIMVSRLFGAMELKLHTSKKGR